MTSNAIGIVMVRLLRPIICLSLLCSVSGRGGAPSGAVATVAYKKPLTVGDWVQMCEPAFECGIELPETDDPKGRESGHNQEKGSSCGNLLAVIKRPNINKGTREFSLVLYTGKDIIEYVNKTDNSQLPCSTVLMKFETSATGSMDAGECIVDLAWFPRQRQISFRAFFPENGERAQIYLYDLEKRVIRQLTHHPAGVESYSLSLTAQTLVFTSFAKPARDGGKRYRYIVGGGKDVRNNLTSLSDDPEGRDMLKYYALDLRIGKVTPIESDEIQSLPNLTARSPVFISPSGQWAVRYGKPRELTAAWADYPPVRKAYGDIKKEVLGWRSTHESEGFEAQVLQYFLMDLKQGTTKYLIDAPVESFSVYSGTGEDGPVAWSEDESVVYVAETYLPQPSEQSPQSSVSFDKRALAAIELGTGKVTPIDMLEGHSSQYLSSLRREGLDGLVYGSYSFDGSIFKTQFQAYEYKNVGWIKGLSYEVQGDARPLGNSSIQAQRFQLRTSSYIKTPPELQVLDRSTLKVHTISSLNSSFSDYDIGRIEVFRWSDEYNESWEGGILLPEGIGMKDARGLPVVIQVSSWRGLEYGSFGLMREGNPGALFLARGIAVLQVQAQSGSAAAKNPAIGSLRAATACLDGAVKALVDMGIADSKRIGLIGHSAQGNVVINALAFGKASYAAALANDSVQSSIWGYMLSYGNPPLGMGAWDSRRATAFIGDQLSRGGVKQWVERSTIHNLDRVRAPILFEIHNSSFSGLGDCSCWDLYAGLKRAQRPVELAWYPEDRHVLSRVAERYFSREAALDWFAFWLKDEEDPSPQKAEQYERWRLLRRQQSMHLEQLRESDSRGLPQTGQLKGTGY